MPQPRHRVLTIALAAGAVTALVLTGCAAEPGPPPSDGATSSSPSVPGPSASVSSTPTSTASPSSSVSSSPSAPGKDDAYVTIITADVEGSDLEVTAMVADIVESDGTCTLVATRRSNRMSDTASGTPGPASTYCGLMTIPTSSLSAGEWTITVEYDSTVHSGESAAMTVDLP